MESISSDDSDSDEGYSDHVELNAPAKKITWNSKLEASSCEERIVLHLDIDCFYCQCEVNADPTLRDRPLAIQQKHIVVTCNYKAREQGVQKLMLKTEALKRCPSLVIVDGSDLTKYRRQSRRVYMAFRNAVKSLVDGKENPVCKGCMDEMKADITLSTLKPTNSPYHETKQNTVQPFIYGETNESVTIKEDQSGIIYNVKMSENKEVKSSFFGRSKDSKRRCSGQLKYASYLAHLIKNEVYAMTNFTVSVGISVSPMLAKFASELKKPNSINILYPWHSETLMRDMPLRKVPQLGSRTIKLLNACLEEHHQHIESLLEQRQSKRWWTCRDLISVPKDKIVDCLRNSKHFNLSCEERTTMLLACCQGIDETKVIDDGGCVAKTVSVEDSFVRGSVRTHRQMTEVLGVLSVRLPQLLLERKNDSPFPSMAYPNTIRLTLRLSQGESKCRSSWTTSKQSSIMGQNLMNSLENSCEFLVKAADPLLEMILQQYNFGCDDTASAEQIISVTRMNLAATNFDDVNKEKNVPNLNAKINGTNKNCILFHCIPSNKSIANRRCSSMNSSQKEGADYASKEIHESYACSSSKRSNIPKAFSEPSISSRTVFRDGSANIRKAAFNDNEGYFPEDVDPLVLKELPPNIVKEIMTEHSKKRRYNMTTNNGRRKKGKSELPLSNYFKTK